MKTYLPAAVGVPGVVALGLFVWVSRVLHPTPTSGGCSARLLCGADEYWNGDYPDGELQ